MNNNGYIFHFSVNLTTDDINNTHARTRTKSTHAAYKRTEYMKKKTQRVSPAGPQWHLVVALVWQHYVSCVTTRIITRTIWLNTGLYMFIFEGLKIERGLRQMQRNPNPVSLMEFTSCQQEIWVVINRPYNFQS